MVESDEASDKPAREALFASTRRIVLALDNIRRLEKTLSDNETAEGVVGDVNLAAFIPKRSYSLGGARPHFTPVSPVLRHSVRLALAMMAGAIIAQFLGDSRHGNWVLLTIAVVMRADLRAHQAAPRRPRRRHADRLRHCRRRGRVAAGGRAGRGTGCVASPSSTASPGSIIGLPRSGRQ